MQYKVSVGAFTRSVVTLFILAMGYSATSAPLQVGANLNVNVDVLGIGKEIASAVNTAQNREGFVKNLMESTFYKAGQRYNVMVFNMSQGYNEQFRGVKFYASAVYSGGITYGIWAFKDGEFTNQGDGGSINWAFKGSFTRDGNQGHHVTFSR